MPSESSENTTSRQPVPAYILPYMDRDDEVSLVDLWRVMARRKLLILGVLLATIMLAVVYLVVTPPVYTAESRLVAPGIKDIRGLQLGFVDVKNYGIDAFNSATVFSTFVRNFNSVSHRRQFYAQNNLKRMYIGDQAGGEIDENRLFENSFSSNLKISLDQSGIAATGRFSYQDAEQAAGLLNDYVKYINEQTVHELLNDIEAIVQTETRRLQQQLDSKLKVAAQERQDQITQYREALDIARELGIREPTDIALAGQPAGQTTASVEEINDPLYARGTDWLEAEIRALESRKSDLPFIEDGYELQGQLLYLQSFSINEKGLSTMRVDAPAYPPYRPDKPKKRLTLILAVVVGLLLGVFLAFFVEFLSKVK
ncbi:MAG: hypothetical protein CMK32_04405 [Porticoccaceae bacterium]|nr:hypothetical protein [Porticoccaceae bacterium]